MRNLGVREMGLRERAIKAYEEDKKKREESERREAESFAERKAKEFERIFGVKPDKVQPVTPYECSIECDGLTFRVRDTAFGARFEAGIPCPKCERLVFMQVDSLAGLGYWLTHPVECSECVKSSGTREPSVEEQIVQKLREILDLLQEG